MLVRNKVIGSYRIRKEILTSKPSCASFLTPTCYALHRALSLSGNIYRHVIEAAPCM